MKKILYLTILGLLWFIGFTMADVTSVNVSPTAQSAISGSLVTFTITWTNTTGDAYLKYVLPKSATYDFVYQNATLTPLNNALLSLWAEHDPIFYIPANSSFSVTVTAKVIANVRSFPSVNAVANFGADMQVTSVLTSAVAQITPISDLFVTNVLTGLNPSFSGDIVSYAITVQNIWSSAATGISFISTFPIPTLNAPTATFNGTPHAYVAINYPQDFLRSGAYLNTLNPGQTITIMLTAPMTQNFAVGTAFSQIAKAIAASAEYTTGNNAATAAWTVQSPADVRVTKTLASFTGYHAGDQVIYTIAYGNNGGKPANNVIITDIMSGDVSLPATTFTIWTLPAGSGGTITLTGTFNSTFMSWYQFVNRANITTTSTESATGNNSASATGNIQGREAIFVNVAVSNLTSPQLNNAPYGSGPTTMIQAYSGDILQFSITYGNSGNTVATHAILYLSGQQNNFTTYNPFNGTLNIINIDQVQTITFTGVVGPKNYISFTTTPRITHDIAQVTMGNTVTIVEPLICGDGVLSRNEPCDTQGNLGVLYTGQVCENQQGACVLRTNSIINLACINYQYPNPAGGGMITWQSCSSVNTALMASSCSSMRWSTPVTTNNGYSITYTCTGNNTTSTTPITINCGNGTTISGTWSSFQGICSYAQWFVWSAQCSVGSDTNNSSCRATASANAGLCESITPLDGTVLILSNDNEAEGTFRCETANGVNADITIDCGNGDPRDSDEPTDVFEHTCTYDHRGSYDVQCLVDGVSSEACQKDDVIVDEGLLEYCGDGNRQGYEECDDGNNDNGDGCSDDCTIEDGTNNESSCFNVGNTNPSIEKGELLPFRRTLENTDNIKDVTSCDGQPDGTVLKNSLECTFKVYNGLNDVVYTSDPIACDEDTRGSKALFAYFLSKQNIIRSLDNAFGKYYLDSSDFSSDIFGEYKLVLDRVEYTYCRSDDKNEKTAVGNVCSVNFMLTKSYLAQKSTFGITPKATNVKLDGYTMLDGTKLIDSTDLSQIMVLDESEYEGGSEVNALMDTFINKYDRLAITVPQSSLRWTAFEGLDITVKVVPNQKIYILESDTKKAITLKNITSFTSPFTIVTKNINLIIKGNVDYNGMFLVKDGTIWFEPADAGIDRCPAPQIVKGIFITDEGFEGTDPALKNKVTNLNRCRYGNLQVKGILIGDNIQDLVDSRRSNLNSRFQKRGVSATIKAARRNDVFNGAAVLIEYSPSLRSALPPGASDFTKVLDIYKQ